MLDVNLRLWVYLFNYLSVCLSAYMTKTDVQIYTKLGRLISWDQEENKGLWKFGKVSWDRFIGEGGSRSLEIINDRWTMGQDQICLIRRKYYRTKGHNLENVSWVSSSNEVFCSSQSENEGRMAPRRNLMVLSRIFQEVNTSLKNVLSSTPSEDVGFRNNFFLWYSAIWIEWLDLWKAYGQYILIKE